MRYFAKLNMQTFQALACTTCNTKLLSQVNTNTWHTSNFILKMNKRKFKTIFPLSCRFYLKQEQSIYSTLPDIVLYQDTFMLLHSYFFQTTHLSPLNFHCFCFRNILITEVAVSNQEAIHKMKKVEYIWWLHGTCS